MARGDSLRCDRYRDGLERRAARNESLGDAKDLGFHRAGVGVDVEGEWGHWHGIARVIGMSGATAAQGRSGFRFLLRLLAPSYRCTCV
jgi:hypothetical protein